LTPTQPQGFLAVPPSGNGRGVLVLHPWWGLNDTIRAFCTQLAEAGFIAFAPDLFHGKIASTIEEAEKLSNAFDGEGVRIDTAMAAAFLSERARQGGPAIAVIGFSFGAYYALDLSNTDSEHIRAVVVFYGSGASDFSASKAAYLGHFAEVDEFEPEIYVNSLEESIRAAGRPVTFYRYPGCGHWFFEADRTDAYNPDAATLAWERTLTFLENSLPFDS
jgi:carboxymethylenebutenolidase